MPIIEINTSKQRLYLMQEKEVLFETAISTALKGLGEKNGSYQTPRGWHEVVEAIGKGASLNTVFVDRLPTGEIYTPKLAESYPKRDWILTRILWLSGLEPGFNQGGNCDSKAREIYIHGTPDTEMMGLARSKGCIRMRNRAIITLFNHVAVGTKVFIGTKSACQS